MVIIKSKSTKLHDLEWEAKQEVCVRSMPGDLLMLVKYSYGDWENESMIQEETSLGTLVFSLENLD